MKIVTGNIWDYPADVICITTNGTVKRNGEAVMGRGVALEATKRYPTIAKRLGSMLKGFGNVVMLLDEELLIFPVKHNWYEKAHIPLIQQSAVQLMGLAKKQSHLTYVLPRPGCGNGGLDWEDVRPLLEPLLPDNVHVIDKEAA